MREKVFRNSGGFRFHVSFKYSYKKTIHVVMNQLWTLDLSLDFSSLVLYILAD